MRNLKPIVWELDQDAALIEALDFVSSQYFSKLGEISNIVKLPPPVVYTPLHGVGLSAMLGALYEVFKNIRERAIKDGALLQRHLEAADLSTSGHFRVVQCQALPDPNFSSVKYPNPEEHGVLDLAQKYADKSGVRLIIATDPDADRFALAQKLDNGLWYQFKGDDVGVLLGIYIFQKHRHEYTRNKPMRMYTSAVSSQMLAEIGSIEGFEVEETLTGFKWIGSCARASTDAVFGYEEALGYMIPDVVHDKDGIATAMLFLEACSVWNRMPFDVLQDLRKDYGYFETMNTYFKSPNLSLTREIFETIRKNPRAIMELISENMQCRVRDLTTGTDTGTEGQKAVLPKSPEILMITLWLNGPSLEKGVRCTIRASGTEPKIKGTS